MVGQRKFADHAEEIEYHTKLARIYDEGKRAGMLGLDTVTCPYTTTSEAGREWFLGFAKGREDA